MKLFQYAILAGVLLVAGCNNDAPGPIAPGTQGTDAPTFNKIATDMDLNDRYIVVFKESVARPDEVTDMLMAKAAGGEVHFRYRYAIKGFAATIPEQALEGIRNNPNVDYIERDGVVQAWASQSNPPSWGIDRIDQHNLPLDQQYVYNHTGLGVTVYIIDSGIRLDHQEYNGRASSGWDFVDNDADASDCHGHGTHVAGTVGGTNVGVAKQTNLVGVRVLNCNGSGSYSGVIAGIDWVTLNHADLSVANMSLGGGYSSSLNQAVNNSVAAGVVYAVAAGNSNAIACNYSPASAASALTVGSSTSSDSRSSFSNYGSCVDLFAPGSAIYSSTMNGTNTYATWSGTSMASPHVAGAAALYRQANPTATASQVNSALVAAATPNVLSGIGNGSPNLLLYTLAGGSPGPSAPNAPSGLALSNVTTSSIHLSWTDSANDEDGFRIERSLDGSNWSNLTSLGANTTSYTNTGLAELTTYHYRVLAYNTNGNSGYSNTANATTLGTPPVAPSALALSNVTASSIHLTWTDNATNEAGFRIQRSLDGVSWSDVATAGANATSYTNTGLQSGTAYYYRLYAYNTAGNSGYSNTENATTLVPVSTVVHVGALSGTTSQQGGNWYGHLTVTVHDANGNPASGVTVDASWPGGSGSVTTNASGQCTIDSDRMNGKRTASFVMTINNLSGASIVYNPAANVASSYTFNRP